MSRATDCPDCLPYGKCDTCGRSADASPSMSTAAFAAWLRWRGLIDEHAAPLLAAHPSEVTRWRRGTRPVPRRVARIMELLDTIDAERTMESPEF